MLTICPQSEQHAAMETLEKNRTDINQLVRLDNGEGTKHSAQISQRMTWKNCKNEGLLGLDEVYQEWSIHAPVPHKPNHNYVGLFSWRCKCKRIDSYHFFRIELKITKVKVL